MSFHPNLRAFGQLDLLEVYDFYDTPLLVSCRTRTGFIYLAVAVSGSEKSDEWLYVALSKERFLHVRSGSIDLHFAFSQPEDDIAYLVEIPHDERNDASVTILKSTEILDSMLPAKGEALNLQTDTLPPLEAASSLAAQTARDIVNIKLELFEFLRSEVPAKLLGALLTGVQDAVNAIAQAVRGEVRRHGSFSREVLALNQLAVVKAGGGSFDLSLASTTPPDLFAKLHGSEASAALEEFLGLLAVSGNPEDFQVRLQGQPRVAGHLLKILRAINGSVESLAVEWASPQAGRGRVASISAVAVAAAIAVIEHQVIQKRDDFRVEGRLIGAHRDKKTFEILSTEGETFAGKISDAALVSLKGAVIEEVVYRALISQTETLRPATGSIQEEIVLLELLAPAIPED